MGTDHHAEFNRAINRAHNELLLMRDHARDWRDDRPDDIREVVKHAEALGKILAAIFTHATALVDVDCDPTGVKSAFEDYAADIEGEADRVSYEEFL